jgi:hypothetical protein
MQPHTSRYTCLTVSLRKHLTNALLGARVARAQALLGRAAAFVGLKQYAQALDDCEEALKRAPHVRLFS